MTIADAAVQALKALGGPATLDEIQTHIEKRKLFAFRAKDARGVLSKALRKRCEGSPQLTAEPLFRKAGSKYALIA